METFPLSEIKKELQNLQPKQLQELLLRLAKFKKENKELLSYLLFDAADEELFIENCKNEIDVQFRQINRSSHLYVKKSLRKGLKITNQYIKFSGSSKVEIELLLYFCKKMRDSGFSRFSHPVIWNIYLRQVQRIQKVLKTMHEDLQFDYEEAVKEL
jgi:hypothetical protein